MSKPDARRPEFITSHQSILRRLTFVPATARDVPPAEPGVHFIALNSPSEAAMPSRPSSGPMAFPASRPPPRNRELFKEDDVKLRWSTTMRPGAGLQNLGNTCFMNAVLQVLAHTPPLAEAALNGLVPSNSSNPDDPLEITLAHVKRALQSSSKVISPKGHTRILKIINKRFRLGRQEDSHEFLRCLLDAMHESSLKPFKPKPPPDLVQSTLVNRIFGGKLRSRIKCTGVDYESSTYEDFLDLSLEITHAKTVTRALQHFTAKEVLDGDNKYRCPKNNKLVRAEKQMTIEEAPNVLTIHLKRFQYGGFGSKINKPVAYDPELNLQHYMSRQDTPLLYDLYGVLVHVGHTVHTGHYYCFVRAGNKVWHRCDDTQVAPCGERAALSQSAYILFYIRRHPRSQTPHVATQPGDQPQPVYGPAPPPHRHHDLTPEQRAVQHQMNKVMQQRPAKGDVEAQTADRHADASQPVRHQDSRQRTQDVTLGPPAGKPGAKQQQPHTPFAANGPTQPAGPARPSSAPAESPHSDSEPPSSPPTAPTHSAHRGIPLQHTRLYSLPRRLAEFKLRRRHSLQNGELLALLRNGTANGKRALSRDAAAAEEPSSDDHRDRRSSHAQASTLRDMASARDGKRKAAGAVEPADPAADDSQAARKRSRQAGTQGAQAQPDPLANGRPPSQKDSQNLKQDTASTAAVAAAAVTTDKAPVKRIQPQAVQPTATTSKAAAAASRPAAAVDAPVQQVTGAAALELLLQGAPSGTRSAGPGVANRGVATSGWEDGDQDLARQARALTKDTNKRARDEWDEEYDRGKTKKVKSKDKKGADLHDDGNAFQRHLDEKRHGRGGGRGRSGGRGDRGGRGGRGDRGFGGGGRDGSRFGGRGGGRDGGRFGGRGGGRGGGGRGGGGFGRGGGGRGGGRFGRGGGRFGGRGGGGGGGRGRFGGRGGGRSAGRGRS